MGPESDGVTAILERVRQGSAEAKNELITWLYDRFRQRAHQRLMHERPGHSLATNDLVNESLLRLLRSDEFEKAADTNQVFRAFARTMRQLLIDHARKHNARVRGGGRQREELDDLSDEVRLSSRSELLSLDEALTALAVQHSREAEVVEMRFFGGYELGEIAESLSVSLSTVERDSRFGLAWLRAFLSPGPSDDA